MKKYLLFIWLSLSIAACKDAYDIDVPGPATGYLVVDGFINSGDAPTTIQLSRTSGLNDPLQTHPERGAHLAVEGENGQQYNLFEIREGEYILPPLHLDPSTSYRLTIQTAEGKSYASGYRPVLNTPPIDQLSWRQEENGIRIYLHAEGNADTKYFQWMVDETWEVNARYVPNLHIVETGSPSPRVEFIFPNQNYDLSQYRCWQFDQPASIEIGSTEKLTQNVLFQPIRFIENGSVKLSVLYSVLVKQYALSAEGYNYLLQMKKNSEQLGSIFDPQPSEAKGNIISLSHPDEIVIGFIDVTEEQTNRLFISNNEVAPWGFMWPCDQVTIPNNPDSIQAAGGNLPIEPESLRSNGDVARYVAAPIACVDCRALGSPDKPAFWPR